MAGKRKTWYKADRDDESGEVMIITKRRVNCPDGFFPSREEAIANLESSGKEDTPQEISCSTEEESKACDAEAPPGADDPEPPVETQEDATQRRLDDDDPENDASETSGERRGNANSVEPAEIVVRGSLDVPGETSHSVALFVERVGRNYSSFIVHDEVPGGIHTARVAFLSAHTQTKRYNVRFSWKKPRRINRYVREWVESELRDRKIQDRFNQIMLDIRSGRADVIGSTERLT